MQLCLQCALIGRHEAGCPTDQDGADPKDPKAKHARAVRGMEHARSILAQAGTLLEKAPREALRFAWIAEKTLDFYPSGDLQGYDMRRARNELAEAAKKMLEEASLKLDERGAARFLEDLDFTKQALETFAQVARRRHEAVTFDLSEFVELPKIERREVGDALRDLCQEIENQLASTKNLEAEVAAWGPENMVPLARDEEPTGIPDAKIPPLRGLGALRTGVKLFFAGLAVYGVGLGTGWITLVAPFLQVRVGFAGAGALLSASGMIAATLGGERKRASELRRRRAPAESRKAFKQLSVDYRQRVYLSAALRILQRKARAVEKAEQAFRKVTGGEAAGRWKRLCTDDKELIRMFFDWDGRRPIKDAVSYAVDQAIGPKGRLRPFDEMAPDAWEVLLKAFLLDIFAGEDARFFDGIAPLIAEGAMEDHEMEAFAKDTIQAWEDRVG